MRIYARIVSVGAIILWYSLAALAQHTVYKWVDKEGVVHFSDEPPAPSQALSVEEIKLAESPPHTQASPPPVRRPATTPKEDKREATRPPSMPSPETTDIDFTALTLEELDRRCEAERETKIAPLREAEIDKCINEQRKDPAYCKRFFADYGAGGKTIYDTVRPRMFHDLPVCIEAEKKRQGGRSRVQ
jgi:hypothetical protein